MTESGIQDAALRQAACLADWERIAGTTAPADRRAAEAASAACHKAFVWLGKLESCIWVGSFREMRCVIAACAPPLSWLVMYKMGDSVARAVTSGWAATTDNDAARAFNSAMHGLGWFETGRHWEKIEESEDRSDWDDDDEEEDNDTPREHEPDDSFDPVVDEGIDWNHFPEELAELEKIYEEELNDDAFDPYEHFQLVRYRMDKVNVIPVVYSHDKWAALDAQVASGDAASGWLGSLSMEVLRHCAAFFPLPGAMLLCERPVKVEGVQTGAGRLVKVEFRSGVVEYGLDGVPLNRRQYDLFLDWDLVDNSRILHELKGELRRMACRARGIESMAGDVFLYFVENMGDDRWLRRRFVDAMPPELLLYLGDSTWTEEKEGVLVRIPMSGDEDVCVLRVKDATPGPDGTEKYHCLRVPPTVESVREAIAWTFGIDNPEDYAPVVET